MFSNAFLNVWRINIDEYLFWFITTLLMTQENVLSKFVMAVQIVHNSVTHTDTANHEQ